MSIQKLYKAKSLQSLNTELLNLLRTQMNVRMQLKMGQINHTHLLKRIRRDIARVKTCLSNGMRSHNNV